jgi:hypothetical protein
VVINEVLYDVPAGADVNGDGVHDPYEDAFIELVNVSGAVVDLSRWRIHNLRTVFGVSHEVPPGTRLDPGQALVIWGGGTPAGTPCNRINQEASEDSLWFNVGVTCDAADGIVLLNGGLYVDGDYQCNNAIDAAFTRSPDLLGSFVDHTTTPTGLPYSPGCREDGVTGF